MSGNFPMISLIRHRGGSAGHNKSGNEVAEAHGKPVKMGRSDTEFGQMSQSLDESASLQHALNNHQKRSLPIKS
jgi:hypothetical protein